MNILAKLNLGPLKSKTYILIELFIIGILADIFINIDVYIFIMAILVGIWLAILVLNGLGPTISAYFGITLLALTPVFLSFKWEEIAEKTAIWAYTFMVISVFQLLIEYYRKPKENRKSN